MNEQITVNFENLNEDERNQFMALIEKSNMPKWWENTEFDIQDGDVYYYISDTGIESSNCKNNSLSYHVYRIGSRGNACKDEIYIQQRAKCISRANLVANFAKVVNGDWDMKTAWDDDDLRKYYIFYNHKDHCWGIDYSYCFQHEGITYFKSKEAAQRCIDEVLVPLDEKEKL